MGEMAAKRDMVFKAQVEAAEKELERLKAKELEELELARVKMIEAAANAERVAYREDQLEVKRYERMEELERAQREREEAEARLEALAKSVPYRERIDKLEMDFERVSSHTTASEHAAAIGKSHAEFLAANGDVRKLV